MGDSLANSGQLRHLSKAVASASSFKDRQNSLHQKEISNDSSIISGITGNNPVNFIEALAAIEERGKDSREILHRLLDNPDATTKKLAIQFLGRHGNETTVEALKNFIHQENNELRAAALLSLKELSKAHPSADIYLKSLARESHDTVNLNSQLAVLKNRFNLIPSMQIGSLIREKLNAGKQAQPEQQVLSKLKSLSTSANKDISTAAFESLAIMNTDGSNQAIAELIGASEGETKKDFILKLLPYKSCEKHSAAVNKMILNDNGLLDEDLISLISVTDVKLSPEAIKNLASNKDPAIREIALNLDVLEDPEKTSLLKAGLSDGDLQIRLICADRLGSKEAFNFLMKELNTARTEDLSAIMDTIKNNASLKNDRILMGETVKSFFGATKTLLQNFPNDKDPKRSLETIKENIGFLASTRAAECSTLLTLALSKLEFQDLFPILNKVMETDERILTGIFKKVLASDYPYEKKLLAAGFLSMGKTVEMQKLLKDLASKGNEAAIYINDNKDSEPRGPQLSTFFYTSDQSSLNADVIMNKGPGERIKALHEAGRYNVRDREKILVNALADPLFSHLAASKLTELGLKEPQSKELLFNFLNSNNDRIRETASKVIDSLKLVKEAKDYAVSIQKKNPDSFWPLGILYYCNSRENDPDLIARTSKQLAKCIETNRDHATDLSLIAQSLLPYDPQYAAAIYLKAWQANKDPDYSKYIMHGLEKAHQSSGKSQGFHKFLAGACNSGKLAANQELIGIINKMEKYNISKGFRYLPENLNRILDTREQFENNTLPAGKDSIMYLSAIKDHNGALATTGNLFFADFPADNIIYFEIGDNPSDDLTGVGKAFNHHGIQADLIIANVHGFIRSADFGNNPLTAQGLKQLQGSEFSRSLKNNGQVIMMSCSTAKGAGFEEDMASILRLVFPQASKNGIQAPIADAAYRMTKKKNGQYEATFKTDEEPFKSREELLLYRNE